MNISLINYNDASSFNSFVAYYGMNFIYTTKANFTSLNPSNPYVSLKVQAVNFTLATLNNPRLPLNTQLNFSISVINQRQYNYLGMTTMTFRIPSCL